MSSEATTAEACPVDHKTRQLWLDQAKKNRPQDAPQPTPQPIPQPTPQPTPKSLPHDLSDVKMYYSLDHMGYVAILPKNHSLLSAASRKGGLGNAREISTIPRATVVGEQATTGNTASPANNEQETGSDVKTGNWIYPSEQMFFDAMKRKNYDPQTTDMQSIVPIHNAVNERAWKEIKDWEKGRGAEACGGPRLVSFSGQSKALTPKARFNSLLGYTKPFDRHDWVVDRCGTQIDYVIDFYSGKDEGKPGKSLSFYLDVRPKLNTWEGVKMRAEKLFGL